MLQNPRLQDKIIHWELCVSLCCRHKPKAEHNLYKRASKERSLHRFMRVTDVSFQGISYRSEGYSQKSHCNVEHRTFAFITERGSQQRARMLIAQFCVKSKTNLAVKEKPVNVDRKQLDCMLQSTSSVLLATELGVRLN